MGGTTPNEYGGYYRNPGTGEFDYVPGTLAGVYVGADGGVWGLNAAGTTITSTS